MTHEWKAITHISNIPVLGARTVETAKGKLAIFRSQIDQIFVIKDACPHKQGPLSQGIMHGTSVTCPLHNWKIDLLHGEAIVPDQGCVNTFETKTDERGYVYVHLPVEYLT